MDPGPRCPVGFIGDFLSVKDVALVADVGDSLLCGCCEGGRGILVCLILGGMIVFVVALTGVCKGGVEDGLYVCCDCVIDVVLTRGNPMFALT